MRYIVLILLTGLLACGCKPAPPEDYSNSAESREIASSDQFNQKMHVIRTMWKELVDMPDSDERKELLTNALGRKVSELSVDELSPADRKLVGKIEKELK
jgi:hypothetical protein